MLDSVSTGCAGFAGASGWLPNSSPATEEADSGRMIFSGVVCGISDSSGGVGGGPIEALALSIPGTVIDPTTLALRTAPSVAM